MLKQNVSALKMVTKIGAVMAILVAASACTHEQLKQEADVSAIEETGATPDVGGLDATVTDPLAAPTPIPGEVDSTKARVKHHVTKSAKHVSKKHARSHKISKKKHKKHKTMIAKGSVEAQLPPPPGPEVGAAAPAAPEMMPVPPAPQDAAVLATPATDLGGESSGGHGLMIVLGLIALGALAFAGVRFRSSRGSRRLVFN